MIEQVFIVCLVAIIIYLLNKVYNKTRTIEELTKQNKQNEKDLQKQYETQISLLQAEHLKIKDSLIEYVQELKKGEQTNLSDKKMLVSMAYQQMVDEITKKYYDTFSSPVHASKMISRAMADYLVYPIKEKEQKLKYSGQSYLRERSYKIAEIREEAEKILEEQYELRYQAELQLSEVEKMKAFEKIIELSNSNTEIIKYASKLIADVETADFYYYAKCLNWGNSKERKDKIKSINSIRREAKEKLKNINGRSIN